MAGLEAFRPVKGRLQRHAGKGGSLVIDDSYNANPDSVRAAIDRAQLDLRSACAGARRHGEVGDKGEQYHTEIGVYARERGIDALLVLGEMTRATVRAFGTGATHFDSVEALLQSLQSMLSPQTTVADQRLPLHAHGAHRRSLASNPSSQTPIKHFPKEHNMLLELAQWLAQDMRAFNVFNYITLRAVLATMTALAISFIAGPSFIRWLTEKKIGQPVRSDGRRRI